MITPLFLTQLSTTSTVSTRDPYEDYYPDSNGKGHGHGYGHGHHHGHGHPPPAIVPESNSYGLFFAAFCVVLLFAAKRYLARKLGVKGCGCGGCSCSSHICDSHKSNH